jgi:hypothetical protein
MLTNFQPFPDYPRSRYSHLVIDDQGLVRYSGETEEDALQVAALFSGLFPERSFTTILKAIVPDVWNWNEGLRT